MGVEVVTFGCRLNTYESEAMQRHAEAAGLGDVVIVNTCAVTAEATRQARQAIRRLARETPGGAHRRHRLRRAGRAASLRRHAGGRAGRRQPREDEGRDLGRACGISASAPPRSRRRRHHGGARDRPASHRRHARAHPRLRAGAERLRPPLHLLHHPVRPRQFALGADGRRGRAGAHASSSTAPARWCSPASTSRATASDLPGEPKLGTPREGDPAPRAGARPAAHLLDRLGRGRRRPPRRDRDRARG